MEEEREVQEELYEEGKVEEEGRWEAKVVYCLFAIFLIRHKNKSHDNKEMIQ